MITFLPEIQTLLSNSEPESKPRSVFDTLLKPISHNLVPKQRNTSLSWNSVRENVTCRLQNFKKSFALVKNNRLPTEWITYTSRRLLTKIWNRGSNYLLSSTTVKKFVLQLDPVSSTSSIILNKDYAIRICSFWISLTDKLRTQHICYTR